MQTKVLSTIERHHMLPVGSAVVVALSGGADSMALLYVLLALSERLSLRVSAAHMNHLIRGDEAERDEAFVRATCEKLGVKLLVERVDVPALAANDSMGLEECGRRERYAFLQRAAADESALIATAHTLSDCCETFLFNFTRGATLRGLCSIPPVRGNVIRPLIDCSRAEIEKYCADNKIEYVSDSTNFSEDYSRNKIRSGIIPNLKELNPAFEAAAGRCVASLNEDEAFLTSLADEAYKKAKLPCGYDAKLLSGLAPAVSKRVLAKILFEETGIFPEKCHVESVHALLSSTGSVQILRSVSFRVRRGILEKTGSIVPKWRQQLVLGDNDLPLLRIHLEVCNTENKINIQKISKQLLANCLDYDIINGNMFAGSRKEGDKIHIKGRSSNKSLRRLFSEKGIPPEERAGVAVFSDDVGVIWVEGFGCSERVAISEKTKHILLIEYERKT